MPPKTERIRSLCKATAKQVEDAYPALQLCYITHEKGRFSDAIALKEHEIEAHPASEHAQTILKKFINQEYSSFLGLAIAQKPVLFGLRRKDALLGLININTDMYKTTEDALHDIQNLAWHAIDLMKIRRNPNYKERFKNGAMIPKRSAYNTAKANLKADAFAATLSGIQSKKEHVRRISTKRATDALLPISARRAEDYPFVVATEPAEFAFEELMERNISKSAAVTESERIAKEVTAIVDESGIGIEQWWNFARPAQDMAWRGFNCGEILGAAVNTSEDPYIRAIGYLIADITNIEPKTAVDLMSKYNAFISSEQNERLHNDMVDSVFEDLVITSLRDENCDAMLLTAHSQNEILTEGNILGWCASALQAAAEAFEKAVRMGKNPDEAARSEFENKTSLTTWNDMAVLGQKIVERKRQGYVMALGHVADICEQNGAWKEVLNAVRKTMTDESHLKKLAAANELNALPQIAPKGLGPAAAPAMTTGPTYQTPAPALPTPGLGDNSHTARRQRFLLDQKDKKDSH